MSKSTYTQGDLFGGARKRTPRGWTELDRIRRRYAILERKVLSGEYTNFEMEECHRLAEQIVLREREAGEKWAKSFRK